MSFYVIDQDNLTSWNAHREAGEKFKTRKAADKRARDLARSEPGKIFSITQVIATVSCPVGAPQVMKP